MNVSDIFEHVHGGVFVFMYKMNFWMSYGVKSSTLMVLFENYDEIDNKFYLTWISMIVLI